MRNWWSLTEVDGKPRITRVIRLLDKRTRRRVVLVNVLSLLEAVTVLVAPLLSQHLFDRGLLRADEGVVVRYGCALMIVLIAGVVSGLLRTVATYDVGLNLLARLRVVLYGHMLRLPLDFFVHSKSGALESRLHNDVLGAQLLVSQVAGQGVSNVLVAVAALVGMTLLDVRLAVVTLVFIPPVLWLVRWSSRRAGAASRESAEANAALAALADERLSVGGATIVKTFGLEDDQLERFAALAAKQSRAGIRQGLYASAATLAIAGGVAVLTGVVQVVGGILVVRDAVTVGSLVAFLAYLHRLMGVVSSLGAIPAQIAQAGVSFSRIFEILDLPTESTSLHHPSQPSKKAVATPGIELRGVTYAHPMPFEATAPSLLDPFGEAWREGEPPRPATTSSPPRHVLRELDLVVPKGKRVALVGTSGEGKTTVAELVAGLRLPTAGWVAVNGTKSVDVPLVEYRPLVAYVPQEPILFNESIRVNLYGARLDITADEVTEVCRLCCLSEVIEALPDRLDTVVGDLGSRLSGGERQRFAIARALLKRSPVCVFDETTAHLDPVTERVIDGAIRAASGAATVLVIAHRLSTVKAADEILVLNDGRIVENGTHDELLKSNGRYRALLDAANG